MLARVVVLLAACAVSAPALAADAYPTVKEVEQGLSLKPGDQLPRQVPTAGRAWNAFYVGARALGNGYYDVRVRLK